ncbi:sensor histidine kinase [Pacificibacter marinus]|uniref:histidine kinase n=1 Tax=Pacificibacter marinus TaxID=658057 RepID=A0A1Y5RVA3_9RHOB|nr:HAMP domain-containing sensor histidine kinase [Pacificibacter marinus]SEK43869.1 His Kinase A (phospho-acceptor) domain-containing protein [Pacificibacter marinus]SLN23459.1 Sensor histidine kinase YycG [Pacificibacter marinus]
MKPRAFQLKLVLFGFAIAGLIAATLSLVGLRTQILQVGDSSSTGPIWFVTAIERDVQEFQIAIASYELGLGTFENANLRFDILWSRVSGANRGEVADKLLEYQVDTSVINLLQVKLLQYEQLVMNIDTASPASIHSMINDFNILNRDIHGLALDVLQASSNETREWREALLRISGENVAIGVAIGLTALALILLLRLDAVAARNQLAEKDELLIAAEAANLAKSEFIAAVNHELRTPLTSISGAISLMGSGAYGEVPEAFKKPIQIASRNAKQLGVLISDLLNAEKLSSGSMNFHADEMDLASFLTEQVESNKPYVETFNVELSLNANLPKLSVRGDRQRLGQVLANLISNAAKFSNAGTQVVIGLERVQDRAVISVKDQGRGIPESAGERLFERFQQVDSSDARERGGTGLGLSIVKSIVDAHGGTVWYDSVLGKGTTFYFDLPLES